MKHKLTSTILTLALVLTMSAPTYAASCRVPVQTCGGSELLYRLLCRYAGWCGDSFVIETPATPEQPAKPENPVTPEQPAKPETPAQTPSAASAYEREVIRLVNEERAKNGLSPLTEDAALTRTARMKSQDMRDNRYFDHNSPTYGTPFDLMRAQGVTYRTAGENIAMGYATPEAVVRAWMNSSGHRANILNASYTRIGVGYVAEGSYWTQHFAG